MLLFPIVQIKYTFAKSRQFIFPLALPSGISRRPSPPTSHGLALAAKVSKMATTAEVSISESTIPKNPTLL